MFNKLNDIILCEFCGQNIEFDPELTLTDYSNHLNLEVKDVSSKVEDIIGNYLVYRCSSCNSTFKFTYKDIEFNLRKKLTEKLLILIAKGSMMSNLSLYDKYFIYCGKCKGVTGTGSCTKSVFNTCEIKRFPSI